MEDRRNSLYFADRIIGGGLWLILLSVQVAIISKLTPAPRNVLEEVEILRNSQAERFEILLDKLDRIQNTVEAHDAKLEVEKWHLEHR